MCDHFEWLLHGYSKLDTLISTATEGVTHQFRARKSSQVRTCTNHNSALSMEAALRQSIYDGQRSGTYLVLSENVAKRWQEIHYSPFGCVEKAGVDPSIEARVIHDLSFPKGASTNFWSTQDELPTLSYVHVAAIAKRIVALRTAHPGARIRLMKGDVKGAFRHLHVNESVSPYFAGRLPNDGVVVIDLALPFGWTGSPAHYGVFGDAIAFLVQRESPRSLDPSDKDSECFFCFTWVDDHVLIEVDTGNRLYACENALRLAMTAVLGPRAINEKKFSKWSSHLIALGLEWNTDDMTVSMPQEKIVKAELRIDALLTATTTTRSELERLLGSLRHVCTCIRPASPFFQRLATLYRTTPRGANVKISQAARLDLLWFSHILKFANLRRLPLDTFSALPEPRVNLFMDACDTGLCILHPARREFIRVRFDDAEKELITRGALSINVREQLSATIAVLYWGPMWKQAYTLPSLTHIRMWIDNSSAVSWCNTLQSRNPFSQELNRVLGAAEAEWSLRISAAHLAGSVNYLADLGSRGRPREFEENLQRHLHTLQRRSLADTSRRQYESTWRTWGAFSNQIGRSKWLPREDTAAQSYQLVLFAIHRWSTSNQPRSISTIHAQLSHIRWYHRVYAGFEPKLSTGHAAALIGMRKLSCPTKPRATVSISMLEWIARTTNSKNPTQRLILGAALLGFFFTLRSAEYLGVKGGRHRYALEVGDVQVLDAAGHPTRRLQVAARVVIRLRGSKTDQVGTGTSRSLQKSGRQHVCPVLGALLLLELAALNRLRINDPICSIRQGCILKAETISKVLKKAAAATGGEPNTVSCHSLRSGGATALITGGIDSTTIMLHGRWRSNTFQRYTRYTEAVGAPLAAVMAGTSLCHDLPSSLQLGGSRRNNGVPSSR